MIETSRMHSLAYNAMVRLRRGIEHTKTGRHLWRKAWHRLTQGYDGPVTTKIHGQKVVVNCGYTYPMFTRMFQALNQPLVELVHQTATTLGRPVHLIDVGAAVGDTVLLVSANCRDEVAHFYCVDGDPQFFAYLTENVGSRPDCSLFNAMLSSEDSMMRSLVRTHRGTASAQGHDEVRSSSLDELLETEIAAGHVDVVKIDIDGFDGRAISGARKALAVATAVIFEWHPILCQQTGNSWQESFSALEAAGYTNLAWFSKYGEFCQFTGIPTEAVQDMMAGYCMADIDDDNHWDVVALKSDTRIDMVELARMRFARNRPSRR